MGKIPHLNLSSFPGGGKSTITKKLLERPKTILIPKYTTRPKRPNEEIPEEYIHVSPDVFKALSDQGRFIAVEPIEKHGVIHHHAIPKIEYWPLIPDDTKLVISVFGLYAPLVKQFATDIKLCFIDFKDKNILKQRLHARCLLDDSDYDSKLKTVEAYIASNIQDKFDFIVYNDGTTKETIAQIDALISN